MPEDIPYDHVRSNTTLEPQTDPEKLTVWWRARTADRGYYCYRVKVLETEPTSERFRFVFQVVGTQTPIEVFLHLDNHHVWPERPSTAQFAKVNEYGFLLIDPEWLATKLPAGTAPVKTPGKWPISASKQLRKLVDEIEGDADLVEQASELIEKLILSKQGSARR